MGKNGISLVVQYRDSNYLLTVLQLADILELHTVRVVGGPPLKGVEIHMTIGFLL